MERPEPAWRPIAADGLVEVGEQGIPAVAGTLARAFADDPVKLHLAGVSDLDPRRSVPFFSAFARLAHTRVLATAGGEAAAIWCPPGQWKVPLAAIARNAPVFIRLYGLRLAPNLRILHTLERIHPRPPHWYLEFIGTDPPHQGRGFGSALIAPVVAEADRQGVGAYLESSKESNLAFYARFGFVAGEPITLPGKGAPPMWPMWRDPR